MHFKKSYFLKEENYYEFKPISIWRINVNKFCVEYYIILYYIIYVLAKETQQPKTIKTLHLHTGPFTQK